MIKTPKFWYSKKSSSVFLSKILYPISVLWTLISKIKLLKARQKKFKVPIICVGNINVGGSGKTPTVMALTQIFLEKGVNAHIVSKGYKGKKIGPRKVSQGDSAFEMGDEPILLSNYTNVWVSKDRVKGIEAAINDGAELILLDDGFQDFNFSKTFSIVTVDAEMGFGNRMILPSGPLREDLTNGLKRADALLIIGTNFSRQAFIANEKLPENLNVFFGEIKEIQTGIDFKNNRFVAVAGIAHPEKFFNTLEKCGAEVIKKVPLPDHFNFSITFIHRLKNMAKNANAQLIVTEKDAVRIPETERINFISLPVRLQINNQEGLMETICSKLGQSFK